MPREIWVSKIKIKGSKIRFKAEAPEGFCPKRAALVYRSITQELSYPMKLSAEKRAGKTMLYGRLDVGELDLVEGDWDVFFFDKKGERHPLILTNLLRIRLLLGNYQVRLNTHILFPMGSTGHMLTLRYRRKIPYDSGKTRLKEFAAFGLYTLLKPVWKKKRIWLVYEKYCMAAQENGYYFFRYCMENLKGKERDHIYYILDKDSPDWEKVQKYGKQVIPFMSLRHMLYVLAAKLYVSTESRHHIYAWGTKPNLITRETSRHDIFFLQHGITALKRVDHIFGKNSSGPMTYFAVTSPWEQKIVTENFGYPEDKVPVVGFARYDVLKDKSEKVKKNILVMPTWRSWLEGQSDEVFCASEYYRTYEALLKNQELTQLLEENHVRLVFHIHPKLREFLGSFASDSPWVELIPYGEKPLNELMMECSMLVTDYSSVSWDVYYMGKPVVFYQFDLPMYMKSNGSYIDMETQLFGDRVKTLDTLVDRLKEYIKRDFREKEEYACLRDRYFPYRDTNNCKRTYDFIIREGY